MWYYMVHIWVIYGTYMVHGLVERLKLKRKVWVTDEVYKLLRKQKTKQKISMAKIACNLIIEKYGEPGGTTETKGHKT